MTTYYRIEDQGDVFGFFADAITAWAFILQHPTLFSDKATILPVMRKQLH